MNRIGSSGLERIGSMKYRTTIRSHLSARPVTRRLIAAAAAVAAACAVSLAACALSSASSAAYAGTSSPAAHTAPGIRQCAGDRELAARIVVSRASHAAGVTYYPLDLTNTGGNACSLSGYPVVSAINRAGQQLGSPAGHGLLLVAPLVILAPGATAHTTLAYHGGLVGAGPGCGPVQTAFELRIYTAGRSLATYAAFGLRACSHAGHIYLSITEPIRAGAGS
jgi:hypothetical protein